MFGSVLSKLKDPSFVIASLVIAVVAAFFVIPAIANWKAKRDASA